MKKLKYFYRFISSRDEIGFETRDFFVRKASENKRKIAEKFYSKIPSKDIAYHISLEGKPYIFAIDVDGSTIEENKGIVKKILDYTTELNWDVPIIKYSGNRGYHLLWRCERPVSRFDMLGMAKKITEGILEKDNKVKKIIDYDIYSRNHLIRGLYSVNLKTDKFSYVVDENFNEIEFDDDLFNTSDWGVARFNIKHIYNGYDRSNRYDNIKEGMGENDRARNKKRNRVKKIPTCVKYVINKGADLGMRHDCLFLIVTYLNANGLSEKSIKDIAMIYNSRCRPPENEKIVMVQVEHILRNGYIPPKCKWIKERGLCFNC